MTTGVPIIQAPGPLAVSSANPRYFTAGAAHEAIYLTGSHVNNNFHDGLGMGPDCPEDPERFDFGAYLELLTERGHNFIRLWAMGAVSGPAVPGQRALLHDAAAMATHRTWISQRPQAQV